MDGALAALNGALLRWRLGDRAGAAAAAAPLLRLAGALPPFAALRLALLCADAASDGAAATAATALAGAAAEALQLEATAPEAELLRCARARAAALRGDPRGARRELKGAACTPGGLAAAQGACLKAQLSLKAPAKASRLLAAAATAAAAFRRTRGQSDGDDAAVRAALAANGGTVLLAGGRPAAAGLCYAAALSAATAARAGRALAAAPPSPEQSAAVLYAAGASPVAPPAPICGPITNFLPTPMACDQMARAYSTGPSRLRRQWRREDRAAASLLAEGPQLQMM